MFKTYPVFYSRWSNHLPFLLPSHSFDLSCARSFAQVNSDEVNIRFVFSQFLSNSTNSFISSAQLNFSGPEFVIAKFWEVLKKIIWQLISKGIRVRGWGNMTPGRARISVPLAGLGQWMVNWLGKVRLDKVYLSWKNKYWHNILKFSQWPQKFSCALFLLSSTTKPKKENWRTTWLILKLQRILEPDIFHL